MIITADMLRLREACADQVVEFKRLFGDQVAVTEALCIEHAQVFYWAWAARNLLPAEARQAYGEAITPAWKAYDEATAAARTAYGEADAAAGKAYGEATAAAWKAYGEATAAARTAYGEAITLARTACNEATAAAFGRIAEGLG